VALLTVSTSGVSGFQRPWGDVNATVKYRDGDQRNLYAIVVLLHGIVEPLTMHEFRGCRLFWHRQVSPAPAGATFGDVGTGHWAFQFVEALAASGVTGGCGGGNFCPNNPITRAEMAVFLSGALGLHWPY
jgi:hypothetical protein